MKTAFIQAFDLVFSGDAQLFNILGVTARMSITSSLAALLIGVPIGVLLALYNFPGKRTLVVINRALMGVPPVVCGLLCYMMFSGVGPLRHLKLLYTVNGMIIAQVLLITPIIIGMAEAFLEKIAPDVRETALGLGLTGGRTAFLLVNESRYQMISIYLTGFGRAIAEVGAVSMVGGAIAYKTNVMTTAIMMYTNRGDFTLGVALGIILLFVSLVMNAAAYLVQARLSR